MKNSFWITREKAFVQTLAQRDSKFHSDPFACVQHIRSNWCKRPLSGLKTPSVTNFLFVPVVQLSGMANCTKFFTNDTALTFSLKTICNTRTNLCV